MRSTWSDKFDCLDLIDWFDQIKLSESSYSKSSIPNHIERTKLIFYDWFYLTNWVGQVDWISRTKLIRQMWINQVEAELGKNLLWFSMIKYSPLACLVYTFCLVYYELFRPKNVNNIFIRLDTTIVYLRMTQGWYCIPINEVLNI